MRDGIIMRLKMITAVCLVLGVIFLSVGFYKRHVYENGQYSWSDQSNVYVGGDAYNYIINGTYFTGYSIIGMGFLIISAITESHLAAIMCSSKSNTSETNVLTEPK